MKIAVVGAGVSGLVTAYLLSKPGSGHEITLFERNPYFGGHSHTISHPTPNGEIGLDTGFLVYNEPAYPRFSALLAELGVTTQASDMSFSVTCRACDLAYSSRGIGGLLAHPRGMLRPARARLGIDILRFYRSAPRDAEDETLSHLTLHDYLRHRHFSDEFRRHFLVPLAAAVWSMPPAEIDAFPAQYMLRFLLNHGLIGGNPARWRWRTVTDGSHSYVKTILDRLGGHTTPEALTAVTRTAEGTAVTTANRKQEFDAVVLACHADEALALLTDPTSEEQAALEQLTFSSNRVVLHTDETLLPAQPGARASWNYVTDDCRADSGLALTYHLNRLQSIASPPDYCVSVNPNAAIAPHAIIEEMTYTHPRYSFETIEAQQAILALNGERRTYFVGAWLGYGFHEDGVESAYRVASLLGAVS